MEDWELNMVIYTADRADMILKDDREIFKVESVTREGIEITTLTDGASHLIKRSELEKAIVSSWRAIILLDGTRYEFLKLMEIEDE